MKQYVKTLILLMMAGLFAGCSSSSPSSPPSQATCNLTNQSACPNTSSNNPTLSDWLSQLNSAFEQIENSLPTTRTPTTISGLIVPASTDWEYSDALGGTDYGSHINAYMDSLGASGDKVMDQEVNMWMAPFSAAAEYTGSWAAGADCNGTGHGGTLALNGSLPAGAGPNCKALSEYDSMFAHANSTGVNLRLIAFKPTPDLFGSGSSCLGVTTAPTEAQYEACMKPLVVALAKRYAAAYPSVTEYQVIGEPKGGLAGAIGEVLSTKDVDTYIVNIVSAVKSAVSSVNPNLHFGAAASAYSYCSTGPNCGTTSSYAEDLAYWQDWIGTSACSGCTASSSLDYVVIDLFAASCAMMDQSQSGYYYSNELAAVASNYVVPATTAGYKVRIGQSQHPVYCNASASSGTAAGENIAFSGYGLGDSFYYTSNVQNRWDQVIHDWSQAYGIDVWDVYCTAPFIYESSGTPDICTSGTYTTSIVNNLLPGSTADGLAWGGL